MQILVLIGLYFLKCTKFDQLILRKIIKIVATRFQILTLKCTKIDFCWGSAPDRAGGAYSAPPDPLAGFKWAYFEGQGREGREERRGREGRGHSTCVSPRFDNPGYGQTYTRCSKPIQHFLPKETQPLSDYCGHADPNNNGVHSNHEYQQIPNMLFVLHFYCQSRKFRRNPAVQLLQISSIIIIIIVIIRNL